MPVHSTIRSLVHSIVLVGVVHLHVSNPAPGDAAVTTYLYESGADVVLQSSGSVDTSALTNIGNTANPVSGFVGPSLGLLSTDDVSSPNFGSGYTGISGPTNFGTGGFVVADTSTPLTTDVFALNGGASRLTLPIGYSSGTPFSGSVSFSGTDLATLGATPGTYTWTWGTGPTADQWTLNVGIIPEPSTSGLAALGLLSLGFIGRRRRGR